MEVISVVVSVPLTKVGAATVVISIAVDVEIGSGVTVVVSIAVDVETGSGVTVVVSIAVDVEMGTEGASGLSLEETRMVEVTKTVCVAAVVVVVSRKSSMASGLVQMPQAFVIPFHISESWLHCRRSGGQP